MAAFIRVTTFVLCSLLLVLPKTLLYANETPVIPQDYTAIYQVLRNDKNLAEVTVRLSHQDDIWTLHGYTHDMRGLADLLNVKGIQTTTGRWQDGRFIPEDYRYSFSLIGHKNKWHASFDWSSGMVTTRSKKRGAELALTQDAVDPFSLSLNIRSQLAMNQPHITLNVVDEDEINQQVFQAEREESVDTALGCLQTTRVKRIHKGTKRTSLAWYANDHEFIPVQIQHSKKKGSDFRLQIISLDVGGQPVQSVKACGDNNAGYQATGFG